MKRSPALTVVAALMLAACAATPSNPDQAKPTASAKPPAGCVGQTATRLPVKDNSCAGFGATYTKQDIDNTGQVDLDRALQQLDPSISRH
jgi:hypothetical protein